MDDIYVTLGLTGVTASTVRFMPAFGASLMPYKGIRCQPRQDRAATSPKGHAPTVEEISLRASVNVRIMEDGGVLVWVGVPICTTQECVHFMVERAVGAARSGGADCVD